MASERHNAAARAEAETRIETATSEASCAKAPRLKNRQILVVEDCPDAQRLLALILQREQADVYLECNGIAAVETVTAGMRRGREFDAVLMDLRMPLMDGGTAVERLRDRGYAGIIVAVTNEFEKLDEAWFHAAGFDSAFGKPVQPELLIQALVDAIGSKTNRRTA